MRLFILKVLTFLVLQKSLTQFITSVFLKIVQKTWKRKEDNTSNLIVEHILALFELSQFILLYIYIFTSTINRTQFKVYLIYQLELRYC
jgi:hypothetical protein